MNSIKTRVLLSLDDECPYQCRHCYTYELPSSKHRSIEEIVESISNERFDIVYVSQKTENFASPCTGLELCEKIFDTYKCNIMIITRNVFLAQDLSRLISLFKRMRESGKTLFVGCSVIGLESACISERADLIPSSMERISFLKNLYNRGIPALLLIRPLFPNSIVPNAEIERLVDMAAGNVSCIVTGPLMVNDYILDRLSINHDELSYVLDGDSEYLSGAIAEIMEFVNVLPEIEHLKKYCDSKCIPIFTHSMPAINYLHDLK